MDDNRIIREAQEYFMNLCREKDAEIDRLKKQIGVKMYRPYVDFKEDSVDWKKIGYLGLIDDLNAMIRTLTEFQAETIRKEAVRQSEEE